MGEGRTSWLHPPPALRAVTGGYAVRPVGVAQFGGEGGVGTVEAVGEVAALTILLFHDVDDLVQERRPGSGALEITVAPRSE
ncbi:MAG: hypothetical protein GYB65_16660 [Chloroflexi bacterium]|nr:hypothetical protein [Chloroflexota bacterium]